MTSQSRNQNYLEFKRFIERQGGKVTGVRVGTKHILVYATSPGGKPMTMTLSKGPMVAGHVAFFTRKKIRETDRNHHGYKKPRRK